ANEEYDATSNSWLTSSPVPEGRHHGSLIECGGLLYALGGSEHGKDYRYDPDSGHWQQIPPKPLYPSHAGRAPPAPAHPTVGRFETRWDARNRNQRYDPGTDSWSLAQSMPTPRFGHAVTTANGKLYAFGGYNGQPLGVNEEYDPATDSWATRAPMPTARYAM